MRTAAGSWRCTCTAANFGAGCSHVAAVSLVVAPMPRR
ncbi:MAG: SWIM zinc finger family protein [Streptosporangiaceae bacterium]